MLGPAHVSVSHPLVPLRNCHQQETAARGYGRMHAWTAGRHQQLRFWLFSRTLARMSFSASRSSRNSAMLVRIVAECSPIKTNACARVAKPSPMALSPSKKRAKPLFRTISDTHKSLVPAVLARTFGDDERIISDIQHLRNVRAGKGGALDSGARPPQNRAPAGEEREEETQRRESVAQKYPDKAVKRPVFISQRSCFQASER